MRTYDYSEFNRCFLGNNLNPELENIVSKINNGLASPLTTEVHPKEKERLERISKRRNSVNIIAPGQLVGAEGFHPHPFDQVTRNTDANSPKISQKLFNYNNSVIIYNGNYGFGIKDQAYFDDLFGKLNEVLKKNNTHILFVRGSGDDPSFFNEEKINYSNIKTVKDYSIVKFKDFNCLCIGGGVSSDRAWKKSNEEILGKKIYWENEGCNDELDVLEETIKEIDIACVITYDSPTFVKPTIGDYKTNKWFKSDKQLTKDSIASRLIMDGVYNRFIANGKTPYVWWYGGTSINYCENISGIYFISTWGIINSLNEIVKFNFGVSLSKEDNKTDSFLKKLSSSLKASARRGGQVEEMPEIGRMPHDMPVYFNYGFDNQQAGNAVPVIEDNFH